MIQTGLPKNKSDSPGDEEEEQPHVTIGTTAMEVYRGTDGIPVVNASHFEQVDMLLDELRPVANAGDRWANMAMRAMASWANEGRFPQDRRLKGIFDRNRYVNPVSPFEKMRTARDATRRDDIVGNAADVTEALALKDMSFHASDVHEKDVWNQIAGDVNLDARLREAWRILYTDSQFVAVTWWGQKTYTSRKLTAGGQKSRKTYPLTVPVGLTFLDTAKITPVGNLMYDSEQLAFVATAEEAMILDEILAARDGLPSPSGNRGIRAQRRFRDAAGRILADPARDQAGLALNDPIVRRIVVSRYTPGFWEDRDLREDGVDPTNLFLLNRDYVSRHTLTKHPHQRFADVRLERTFELLDLKTQLRQRDRVTLIGAANYIVLITKGSDKQGQEAKQSELDNLRANVHTLGSVPVLVGDHRLKVEIISPKNDQTLEPKAWDNLDQRIQATVWGTFAATGDDTSDPLKLGSVIAAGLDGERKMLGRWFETHFCQRIRDTNPGVLNHRATLRFHPRTIAFAFDPARMMILQEMRNNRQLSRDTFLSEFGYDQADEAEMLKLEAEEYDDIFDEQVAFSTPNGGQPELGPGATPADLRQAGKSGGGTRRGGGAAPGTRQGKTSLNPHRSDTGPTKRRAAAEVVEAFARHGFAGSDDADWLIATAQKLSRPLAVQIAGEFDIPYRHQAQRAWLRDQLADIIEATAEEEHDDDDA